MDYTSLFYWLVVADNARLFFGWAVGIFMLVLVIEIIAKIIITTSSEYYGDDGKIERNKDHKLTNKFLFRTIPWVVLFWFLLIFTPTKRDALLIVAGGQTLNYLTTDSTASQIPHEMTDFIVSELKNMAEEAKVELSVNSTKDKVLQEAKNMTSDQLLKKMSEDANFKQIVLDNLK